MDVVLTTHLPGHAPYRGKVRDVYDLDDRLAVVATDRVSAFDWVMPDGVPGKGRVLTALTRFWLNFLKVPDHRLPAGDGELPAEFASQREVFAGRTMVVRKARVIPFECVARGYLVGSGWKEYRAGGTVCGITLPPGLKEASKLPGPIFTPATKAEQGAHDENVPFEVMAQAIGADLAAELRDRTLEIYRRAAAHAESRGVILADTKLEFGTLPGGEVVLVDEVLTPDSSRFWDAATYREGGSPASFDKQFLRDWLESVGWDKQSPPPALPPEVVARTAAKYQEALRRLTA